MIYSIFPDLPDVDELVTGMRRGGVYAGLLTFMRKFSSALAIFLISQAISLAGNVPPASETIDGVTKLVQQGAVSRLPRGAAGRVRRGCRDRAPGMLPLLRAQVPLTPRGARAPEGFLARRRSGEMTVSIAAEEKFIKDVLV